MRRNGHDACQTPGDDPAEGTPRDDFLARQGPEAFARAILEAARAIHIEVPFTQDVRSRFLHIYRQLTRDQGFQGLLVIIDEFKSWQDLHPPGSKGFAEDEHVLETLAFHLPVDNHARIVTIVASQAPPPAKLMGGAPVPRGPRSSTRPIAPSSARSGKS